MKTYIYNYLLQQLKICKQLFTNTNYRKNSKIWDTSNKCHNCPKNRKVCCNIVLMHPKDADGMANSVDPDLGLHCLLCPNT